MDLSAPEAPSLSAMGGMPSQLVLFLTLRFCSAFSTSKLWRFWKWKPWYPVMFCIIFWTLGWVVRTLSSTRPVSPIASATVAKYAQKWMVQSCLSGVLQSRSGILKQVLGHWAQDHRSHTFSNSSDGYIDQALSDKRASHLYPSGFGYHTFKALFHLKIKKKLSFRAAGFHPVQV